VVADAVLVHAPVLVRRIGGQPPAPARRALALAAAGRTACRTLIDDIEEELLGRGIC
jgi:hypothetical protein